MTSDSQPEEAGFSGLSAEVSDVQKAIAEAESVRPRPQTTVAPASAAGGARRTSTSGTGIPRWVLALLVLASVIVLIVLYFTPQEPTTRTPTAGINNRLDSAPPASPVEQPLPRADVDPSTTPERKPPVGTTHIHDAAEMRYCFAEKVRLESARDVIDSNPDVERFNQMVDDFNSRCSRYQYQDEEVRGAVERQVALEHFRLQLEGQRRFLR